MFAGARQFKLYSFIGNRRSSIGTISKKVRPLKTRQRCENVPPMFPPESGILNSARSGALCAKFL